ncbi:MAG TPA: type II secretion system protein, partial [Verrucomicrobiae bacterium]|nr:type II secretion system protein [Verrucomicrobiae bacterium]
MPPRRDQTAFTRLELVVVLACLSLLVGPLIPLFAHTQRAGERSVCVNNLRLVGRAFQVWGKDHENKLPWRTPVAEGGGYGSPRPGAAWREFTWMTNELITPRILACPSDSAVRVARNFSDNGAGG